MVEFDTSLVIMFSCLSLEGDGNPAMLRLLVYQEETTISTEHRSSQTVEEWTCNMKQWKVPCSQCSNMNLVAAVLMKTRTKQNINQASSPEPETWRCSGCESASAFAPSRLLSLAVANDYIHYLQGKRCNEMLPLPTAGLPNPVLLLAFCNLHIFKGRGRA